MNLTNPKAVTKAFTLSFPRPMAAKSVIEVLVYPWLRRPWMPCCRRIAPRAIVILHLQKVSTRVLEKGSS